MALLATLLALAACDFLVDPALPPGAVRLEPPARYRLWWDMVQSCSGRTGDMRHVQWYHVPDATELDVGDAHHGSVTGMWYRAGNRIVMAGASVLKGDEVRHEMLHALVRAPGHPAAEFQDRCGGIVSCGPSCQEDGGGALVVPHDARAVRATSLQLRLQVLPERGDFATDSGAVTAVLAVTNPYDYPVRVPYNGYIVVVRIDPEDGSASFIGAPYSSAAFIGFPARGTRRWVFDFVLPPGAYTVQGYFRGARADSVEYDVAP